MFSTFINILKKDDQFMVLYNFLKQNFYNVGMINYVLYYTLFILVYCIDWKFPFCLCTNQ